MERTKQYIEEKMNADKVSTMILALEIIANGSPISIGLNKIGEIAKKALDKFDE